MRSFGLALAACALITGCSTNPGQLNAVAGNKVSSSTYANADTIRILSLTDKRGKDAVLSDMYGRPMDGADVLTWLENSLVSRNFDVSLDAGNEASDETVADSAEPAEASSETCDVDLFLRRAEMFPQATSLAATIVLQADIEGRTAPVILRGQHAAMNWASMDSEMNALLARALDKALVKLVDTCDGDSE